MPTRAHRKMSSLSSEQLELIASRASAIGEPTRVRILSVLERGELAVGRIAAAADTRQSTASKHLQVLFHAGLVQRRRDAGAVFYWLSSPDVVRWCRFFASPQIGARTQRR
jgi:DNA-binding transcriptional ArsR family regulator